MLTPEQNRQFVLLWSQHGQRVYAYLFTLVPHHADADELFQETATTLWEQFHKFEPESNFQAWACRVAFNKVRNFRKTSSHRPVAFSDQFVDLIDEATIRDSQSLDAENVALADCLQKLTIADQQLIGERYQSGASVRGVAESSGRSVHVIYKALSRIHDSLLECMQQAAADEEDRS